MRLQQDAHPVKLPLPIHPPAPVILNMHGILVMAILLKLKTLFTLILTAATTR